MIGAAQEVEARGGDFAEDADGEPGAGERLPPDELLFEAELLADLAHFVLEQQAQRLDQLEAHPIGQAADVVMALDRADGPDDRHAFDHVRVERALPEEVEVAELLRFGLEHVDERRADGLALRLRVGHARQPVEEQLHGIGEDERQLHAFEATLDLLRFVLPHHAVVDEDARQPIADGAVDEHRRDGRVDAAAQPTDDAAVPDLRADAVGRLLHERTHRPVAGAAADVVGEVAQDLEAVVGVRDLGMEQQCVEIRDRARPSRPPARWRSSPSR